LCRAPHPAPQLLFRRLPRTPALTLVSPKGLGVAWTVRFLLSTVLDRCFLAFLDTLLYDRRGSGDLVRSGTGVCAVYNSSSLFREPTVQPPPKQLPHRTFTGMVHPLLQHA
jgi:hypothetical protein